MRPRRHQGREFQNMGKLCAKKERKTNISLLRQKTFDIVTSSSLSFSGAGYRAAPWRRPRGRSNARRPSCHNRLNGGCGFCCGCGRGAPWTSVKQCRQAAETTAAAKEARSTLLLSSVMHRCPEPCAHVGAADSSPQSVRRGIPIAALSRLPPQGSQLSVRAALPAASRTARSLGCCGSLARRHAWHRRPLAAGRRP